MDIELTAAHEDLTFMAPLSQERAGTLVSFLADGLGAAAHPLVLDVGCSWAELLLRVLEEVSAATGIGVDTNVDVITHGRSLAERRGLSGRLQLDAQRPAPP